MQTYRTCDAPLEVTHALPPHPRARAVTRPTPTMHTDCTHWPGQLHGPHPPCTQPAPTGQGSYTAPHPPCTQPAPTGQGSHTAHTHHVHGLHPLARAVTWPHTHHAHGLRVQPSSAQRWTAGHIWCQAVTLTLPQSLPARGYLGRREAASVDSMQNCAAQGSRGSAHDAHSVTSALCDGGCNQPRDKDPQPGSRVRGERQSLNAGGSALGSCSRPQCHPWALILSQASGTRGLWACSLLPQSSFPHL